MTAVEPPQSPNEVLEDGDGDKETALEIATNDAKLNDNIDDLGSDSNIASAATNHILTEVLSKNPNAEDRPQQREMAQLVSQAASSGEPLIIQAGTGTGKSLAYLCAAVGTEASTVVSTATKQLSDQLVQSDIPLVAEVAQQALGRPLTARSLKGRSNYLCLAKLDELKRLEAQSEVVASHGSEEQTFDLGIDLPESPSDIEHIQDNSSGSSAQNSELESSSTLIRPSATDLAALRDLLEWAEDPGDGDRVGAPAAPERVWMQIATTAAGCPGARACAFGEACYAEIARDQAREADIVVANHALLAQDLVSPNPLFETKELVVVDEVHELHGYLARAWGYEINSDSVERVVLQAVRRIPKKSQSMLAAGSALLADISSLASGLVEIPAQRWVDELPGYVDGPLESMELNLEKLKRQFKELITNTKEAGETELAARYQSIRGQLGEIEDSVKALRTPDPEMVRWSRAGRDGSPGQLECAPIEVGRKFRTLIGERSLVATSATAAVGSDFTPMARVLGLAETNLQTPDGTQLANDWSGADVGSPFDYPNQGILYIPTHIPEPVGKDRFDHTEAVLEELTVLVTAAGGRTLALFTTTAAVRAGAEQLRATTPFSVLEQGELPSQLLAEEFAADETSVLCATMGMWNGLNIVGPACSLVVIDKIPFAPMNDPLVQARRENAEAAGRNGFNEVFVTDATLALTQGAGRLIRSHTDRGVVAILDQRLLSKGYGKTMLRSLPPMWRTSDQKVVINALERLVKET